MTIVTCILFLTGGIDNSLEQFIILKKEYIHSSGEIIMLKKVSGF